MKIHAPNGDVIEFPDGTPDSTILDVMRREYGGPQAAPAAEQTNKGTTQPIPSALEDTALSGASGLARGVVGLPGLPGSIEELGRAGINLASRTMTGGNAVSPETALPTSEDVVSSFERTVAPITHTPQTRAGQYARTIGEFAPGAALPGSLTTRLLLNVAAPAVASEATGQALEGTSLETPGRVAAALLAPSAARFGMRTVTPLPADPARAQQAAYLAGEGVDLTAGQRTGSRVLGWAESSARDMPFAGRGIAEITRRQGEQLSRALLRRVGENAPDITATPPVNAAARARIGAEFDRVTQNPLPLNQGTANQIATRLGNAFRQYLDTVPNAAQRPFVENFMNDVLNSMTTQSGRLRANIPGQTIQSWRSRLERMASETTDPEYAAFLRSSRETLDDIYGAALPPGEAAAWETARRQYRHLMVLEDAVAGSAMGTPYGTVTPAALRRASRAGNPRAFAEGRGTYSDIAHAAGTVMDSLPNSGTPARLSIGWGIPGAIAGSVGDALLGAPGGATMSGAALSAIVGPALQGRAVSSPRMQAYLGNQLLAGPLNAGVAQPAGLVARSLMLPAQMQGAPAGR